jgi:carbonic anhydrase/acetyltransferase-like protein (isoleucine patch superfamily)
VLAATAATGTAAQQDVLKEDSVVPSQVGKGAIVAAGSVLLPGTVVPSGEVWAGNPAAKHRDLKDEERSYLPKLAAAYVDLGTQHSKAVPKTLEVSLWCL